MYFRKYDSLILFHFNILTCSTFFILKWWRFFLKLLDTIFCLSGNKKFRYLCMFFKKIFVRYLCMFFKKIFVWIKIKVVLDRVWILEQIKIYKVKEKKVFNLTRWLLKLKILNSQLLLKLLMASLELSQISKMELFVKIVNGIKLLTIFTKTVNYFLHLRIFEWVLNTLLSFENTWK